MKYAVAASVLIAGLAFTSSAQANGVCAPGASCFRKVETPPVYGTFQRAVMVRPAQTNFAKIPAQYATTNESILVRPAQQVPIHHPAVTRTVAEQVLVQPATRVWTVTRDAHGHEIGCWVDKPAVYVTQHRTVVVQPAMTSYQTIPAQYGAIQRTVVVSPERLVAQTTPAVYATQSYQAQISPGSVGWQPIGHRAPAHHARHQHHQQRHPHHKH